MAYGDLRHFIQGLEAQEQIKHVSAQVDKDWEIACIARWLIECTADEDMFGLQFDNVKGYQTPVVVGLYSNRDLYAKALGITRSEIIEHWANALKNEIKPAVVDASPVKARIATGHSVDLNRLPVPIWTPGRDGGPYIPSASIITKDPETGIQNVGVYRIQIHDQRTTGLFFGTAMQHGAMHYARYCKLNQPMPVAIVIGGPPAVNFAAAAKTAYGVDEIDIAGGLAGSPIEVVSCETVDLRVPAGAEIVVEGLVQPERKRLEGPFGEALGYMNLAAPAPVVDVTAVCMRENAIFHGYLQQLPPSEGHLIWEMGLLGSLWFYLKDKLHVEALTDLAILSGSAGLGMLAVQVRMGTGAEGRDIGNILAKINFGQKGIVLFDDDIDIHDLETVQWAMTSRVDPARDIRVLDNIKTYQLDPATLAGLDEQFETKPPYNSSMMIVDATVKCDTPALALPGRTYMTQAFERWHEYNLPPLKKRERLARLLRTHSAEGVQENLNRS